jgi:hypothetical protein
MGKGVTIQEDQVIPGRTPDSLVHDTRLAVTSVYLPTVEEGAGQLVLPTLNQMPGLLI